MKEKITAFIAELITYDYILFGSSFVLFIIFFILGIVARKKTLLAILLFILSFGTLFLAPTLGYVQMHTYLFKNSVELTSEKKLSFTEAIVIYGTLKNESNFDFKSCKVTATIYRATGNKYKDYLYLFKPIIKMSIVEQEINKSQTREFKLIVEPFVYTKEYTIALGANCK